MPYENMRKCLVGLTVGGDDNVWTTLEEPLVSKEQTGLEASMQ